MTASMTRAIPHCSTKIRLVSRLAFTLRCTLPGRESSSRLAPLLRICFAIVRPCAIYGPRDTHNSYRAKSLSSAALKDRKVSLFGGGEERRHHLYVSDVAKDLELCLVHRGAGTINAVTPEAVPSYQVAELVMAIIGRPIVFENATPIESDQKSPNQLYRTGRGLSAILPCPARNRPCSYAG